MAIETLTKTDTDLVLLSSSDRLPLLIHFIIPKSSMCVCAHIHLIIYFSLTKNLLLMLQRMAYSILEEKEKRKKDGRKDEGERLNNEDIEGRK